MGTVSTHRPDCCCLIIISGVILMGRRLIAPRTDPFLLHRQNIGSNTKSEEGTLRDSVALPAAPQCGESTKETRSVVILASWQ